jgi:hypothetical protein
MSLYLMKRSLLSYANYNWYKSKPKIIQQVNYKRFNLLQSLINISTSEYKLTPVKRQRIFLSDTSISFIHPNF